VRVGQPEDIEAVPDKPSGTGRAIHVIGAILVVIVLPVVPMDALVRSFGANAMFMGLVYGVIGAKLGGTHLMLSLAPLVGFAAGGGTSIHRLRLVVGRLAGLPRGRGRAGMRWVWLPSLLMLPLAATFATPVSSGRHAVVYGVIAGIATLYGVVLARRFKAPDMVEGQQVSMPQADRCLTSSRTPCRIPWLVPLVSPPESGSVVERATRSQPLGPTSGCAPNRLNCLTGLGADARHRIPRSFCQ
jgi:hypothetical protein